MLTGSYFNNIWTQSFVWSSILPTDSRQHYSTSFNRSLFPQELQNLRLDGTRWFTSGHIILKESINVNVAQYLKAVSSTDNSI